MGDSSNQQTTRQGRQKMFINIGETESCGHIILDTEKNIFHCVQSIAKTFTLELSEINSMAAIGKIKAEGIEDATYIEVDEFGDHLLLEAIERAAIIVNRV